jgi:hypothetical protein
MRMPTAHQAKLCGEESPGEFRPHQRDWQYQIGIVCDYLPLALSDAQRATGRNMSTMPGK